MTQNPGRDRRVTFILLATCILSFGAALLVGIDDNLPGISLLYLSAATLVLTFVYHWRSARRFLVLAGVAAIGFIVFAVLHNVAHGVADVLADVAVVKQLLQGVSVLSFFLALFLFPPAVLIGLAGALFCSLKNRAQPSA
jgi:hypothetical protein